MADLGLQAGKQAQCNEVGYRNGQHVGPDDPRHDVTVQQQGWGNGGVLEAGAHGAPAVSAWATATDTAGPHLPLKVGQLRLTRGRGTSKRM